MLLLSEMAVVTKTWNDPQRPTTTHNDPLRSTTTHNDPTMTHNDPTTTHYDPQRPTTTPLRPTMTHNDPTTTHYDPLRPTTTHYDPQRPHNDPLRSTMTHNDPTTSHNDPQVHNNPTTISACASGSFAFPANFDHMCWLLNMSDEKGVYGVYNSNCYIASVNTKRDWLICSHVALDKCNVSRPGNI
jgi:hypothetical protein